MLNELSRKDIELLNILAKTPEGKSALNEYIEQHKKAVKAYKAYRESVVAEVEVHKVEKSANELRAEVIEKAKDFVDGLRNDKTIAWAEYHRYGINASFIVNTDKRVVVALLMGENTGLIRAKGIAKCNRADVFNEHIGKAIALGRALGKDVSEFENAPQPTEPVVGHKLSNELSEDIDEITNITDLGMLVNNTAKFWTKTTLESGVTKIIDDTNAQYKN